MVKKQKGSIHAGLFLLVTILIVLAAVVITAGRFWWLPPLASEHGAWTDRLFVVTLLITGIVFVLVQIALAYFVFRHRDDPERRAAYFHDNKPLEITWTLVPAVIMTLLIVSGGRLWSRIHQSPPEGAYEVEVWGEQFKWALRYPGKDGQFGRTDIRLINDTNPLGIDTKDPASKDDIFFPAGEGELHLPVGEPVVVRLRSKDVLHSFYVPAFRVKQDAVPGMVIKTWFVPTKEGEFELVCAELCGLGHYQMRGIVIVEPMEKVQEWLSQQQTVMDVIP
ncbi:MAG: cytochrome c oxidase subunit II [Armatimonadetes bacterium]|nr:cytochrome c oxidase subunit II [Armatimonadota bacterium]MDW8121814.1 cytochrome c oxidase subunit II [Armatimonadota bacterium]